jgi:hypothetical protein
MTGRRLWGIACFSLGVLAFVAGVVFANSGDTSPAVGGLMAGPALWLVGASLLKGS